METTRHLVFRPSEEEEVYLTEHNLMVSWTNTIRNWIEQDKTRNKKSFFDKIQSSMLLIFLGLLGSSLTFFLIPVTFGGVVVVVLLFVVSSVCVTIGVISLLWEYRLYVRRR